MPISLDIYCQAWVYIDLYRVLRAILLPPPKYDDIEPTLPDKKAKREKETDGGLFSKVFLKEKLK